MPPASQWIPAEAIAEVEVSRPAAVLDFLLTPELVKTVSGLPPYQKATAEPKFQAVPGHGPVPGVSTETDWAGGVRKLIGGGITAAVGPKGEAILCIDAEDAAMLAKLHQTVLGFAGNDAAKKKAERSGSSSNRVSWHQGVEQRRWRPMPWWAIDFCWPIAWTC